MSKSNPKFTPGPWVATELCNEEWSITDSSPLELCIVDDAQLGSTVKANAHLIAAAPELYEACEAISIWRGIYDDGPNESFERVAKLFYNDTGFLRPGKSASPEDLANYSNERRQEEWNAWVKQKNREIDEQLEAALAKARGEAGE